MLNKNLYYLILITILLCISIDISYYNYIALGKEDDSNDVDNVGEKEKEADDKLSEIAEASINLEAAAQDTDEELFNEEGEMEDDEIDDDFGEDTDDDDIQ